MSNGTKRQKNKKNFNRRKAGDIGYVSSMQRNYKKVIIKEQNNAQTKLF
jgi:hypothetical protein